MFGKILVDLLFLSALGAIGFYFLSGKVKSNFTLIGRVLYSFTALGFVVLSAFLLTNILVHNYQYTYIWSYSSKELSPYLLVASFWAGQEGSFLLWGLLLSVIGLFLMPYARKKGYEAHVMGLYSVIILFILLLLIVKSPFDYVWQSYAGSGIANGFTPANGRGMNPILENIWITIHPPILFAGYAATSVPFVFAVAGLMKKDYRNWVNIALPWNLFAIAMLGLGIMLGGFWAYETLGWGGFWGWDPVENSSLLPWIVATGLAHTMLVQKRTGGLMKTNFFLSIASFVLVLYATFLTRSGILGDSSVHSFMDPGQLVYFLLMLFQFAFLGLGIVVFLLRLKDLPKIKVNFKETSKEFYIALGTLVMLAVALVVFIGTSFPIITGIIGTNKTTVETSFYNNWNLPLIIVVLIVNAISIYLNWRSNTKFSKVIKNSAISLVLTVAGTAALVALGVTEPKYIILGFAAIFSLLINLEFIVRNIAGNPKSMGAYISHFGISLLMVGVLASGGYSQTESIRLKDNATHYAFGYRIKFLGRDQIEKEKTDREKYIYNISAEKDGNSVVVKPVIYYSSFNNWQSPFFEPGIKSYMAKDLYISPKSVDSEIYPDTLVMRKGQEVTAPYDASLKMTLLGYDMNTMQGQQSEGSIVFGSIIKFSKNGLERVDTLYTTINTESQTFMPVWRPLPGSNTRIGFAGIVTKDKMEDTEAIFKFSKEVFIVDVSIKPFISLVWLGTAAIVLGFVVSIFRHISNRKTVDRVQKKETEPAEEAV